MHQVLKIQEILIEIFSNLSSTNPLGEETKDAEDVEDAEDAEDVEDVEDTEDAEDIEDVEDAEDTEDIEEYEGCSKARDLAALARTCRSFKEPALDVLWRVLPDSSPLARCIPDASDYSHETAVYSFQRPPTQTEWNVLQSYTRRIRYIEVFSRGLDWVSVKTFLNPPTTAPLFPNLRKLDCTYTEDITLLRLPLPSYPDFLKSLPETSPNIRILLLHIRMDTPDDTFDSLVSGCIYRLQDLQYLHCNKVTLDTGTLTRRSRTPALTRLTFDLSNASIPSDSSLVFPNLREIIFQFKSPEGTLRFLHQARLPAVTNFDAIVNDYYVVNLLYIVECLPTANTTCTLEKLRFETFDSVGDEDDFPLGFAQLQSYTIFGDLRHLELHLGCSVDLTDGQILTLTSAWPKLEYLSINRGQGWDSDLDWDSGITPGGLIQLLQMCRSLTFIALLLNTHGYTEVPASDVPANLGLTFPCLEMIDVIDSPIKNESVTAIAKFFFGITACASTEFYLNYGLKYGEFDEDFDRRWRDVELSVPNSG